MDKLTKISSNITELEKRLVDIKNICHRFYVDLDNLTEIACDYHVGPATIQAILKQNKDYKANI